MSTMEDRKALLALLTRDWMSQPHLVALTGRPLPEGRRDLKWLRERGLAELLPGMPRGRVCRRDRYWRRARL